MNNLTGYISSSYINAANALNSQKAKRRIVAYVESYDDVFFWRSILSPYETDSRFFEVMLPSRKRLVRGKKSVLQHLHAGNTGKSMIACVDADYDYLLQGCTEQSQFMLSTPYVLHTYAYSIENLQCYSQGLHDVCVMATLNDHRIFDFTSFFTRLSELLYPLFVWSVDLYRHNDYNCFTLTQLSSIAAVNHFRINDAENHLNRVERRVIDKIKWLKSTYPGREDRLNQLDKEIRNLGVTPNTTYLYIHGHTLFESLVVPVLTSVCESLRREREEEINRLAVHSTQRANEIACYQHSVEEISAMLKKSHGYLLSPMVQRIRTDIEAMDL